MFRYSFSLFKFRLNAIYACLFVYAGDWWKSDIEEVLQEFIRTGGDPNASDALTINGQPGHLYPCSKQGFDSSINYQLM